MLSGLVASQHFIALGAECPLFFSPGNPTLCSVNTWDMQLESCLLLSPSLWTSSNNTPLFLYYHSFIYSILHIVSTFPPNISHYRLPYNRPPNSFSSHIYILDVVVSLKKLLMLSWRCVSIVSVFSGFIFLLLYYRLLLCQLFVSLRDLRKAKFFCCRTTLL